MAINRIGCKCCRCCSASVCTECGTDCTPETFGVVIPELSFPATCQECAVLMFDPEGATWEVTGEWGASQEFCLPQASACTWEYQAPFTAVRAKVTFESGSGCGDPCYVTDTILVTLTISGGNARLTALIYDSTNGANCGGRNPTNPGGAGFYLFDSTVSLASLPRFCRNGGSFLGVTPLGDGFDECGYTNGYDNPWASTAAVTATATPCCEYGI